MKFEMNRGADRNQRRAIGGKQAPVSVPTYDWVVFLATALVGILAFGVIAANADLVEPPNTHSIEMTRTARSENIPDLGTGSNISVTTTIDYEVPDA